MTVSSELKIDVQSGEFDKFRKTFDAYKAALESMPATWRGVATQATAAKTSFEASANALALQATSAQSISGHVTKLTQTSGVLARHWHQMHLSTAGVATHIKDMTTSLQSWAGTLGKLALGGAGIAGLGFWGMEAMGRGVMGKRMQAGGYGIGIGGLQSFQTNYARLGSTDEILGGATTAKSKINSAERRALVNLGISNADIDRLPADELAALEVRKFKQFSNSIKDDSLFYTRADALFHYRMKRCSAFAAPVAMSLETLRSSALPTSRKWTYRQQSRRNGRTLATPCRKRPSR
jgi:hypothetical protein